MCEYVSLSVNARVGKYPNVYYHLSGLVKIRFLIELKIISKVRVFIGVPPSPFIQKLEDSWFEERELAGS